MASLTLTLTKTPFCSSNLPPKPSLSTSSSSSSSSKSLISSSNSPATFVNLRHFSMKQGEVRVRRRSLGNEPVVTSEEEESEGMGEDDDGGSGRGGEERDWTTSFLLFGFWIGVMYYVFFIAPNQTPATDMYFVKKLTFLVRNDGFEMNKVLVSVWNMMGLWPLVYAMLLIPTARSCNSKVPVWPFLVVSSFFGIYSLMPYFVLWRPPAPPIKKSELKGWALNILDSKLTAGFALAAGVAGIAYGFSVGGEAWKEFYQYFQSSKLVHVTTIDFMLCSAFAPFWVYNDMTTRKWEDGGSWLIPVSAIPLLGPALYLLMRPSLPSIPTLMEPAMDKE